MSPTNQQFEVVANFYDDLIDAYRAELAKLGHPTDPNDTPEQVHRRYLNLLSRRIRAAPRRTHTARDFVGPAAHQGAIDEIIRKASQGEDLNPHLSKSIAKDADFYDQALNYWGIHHLHLGKALEPNSGFIERTGPLLFARITANDFYLIGIFKHGDWAEGRILEVLHANWPESIQQFRLNGILGLEAPTTNAEHKMAQKKHFNLPLRVADGTVYAPLGGGITPLGISPNIVFRGDREKAYMEDLERLTKANASLLVDKARENGHSIGTNLHLKLTLDENRFPLITDTISGAKFQISIDPPPRP
ncbi:hypothetical protein [Pyxidicoccus xibeiensis]|uniref:hypothetical protein n=1 Tax=Pyxidicoccus xibeiensis TaxID=2906759 RepID=UPI0020A815DA|nr:hypothetical protein [Pyxidicoccus xibeiensis]MCP3142778.1 hypothetical protein [Pyxidicoccus xibeiensis]